MTISHKISLAAKPSPHLMEKETRYAVTVNGKEVGELYHNLRGYRGAIPLVQGPSMDIGEKSFAAWQKAVRRANKDAERDIHALRNDPRRIIGTRPTTDPRMALAIVMEEGSPPQSRIVDRKMLMRGRELLGRDDIGVGFLEAFADPELGADEKIILLANDDMAMAGGRPAKVVDGVDMFDHDLLIDPAEAYPTSDPETLVVIGRTEGDADVTHVTLASYRFARMVLGPALTIGDLKRADPVRVADPAAREAIAREFSWFDLDCVEDAAVLHERQQVAMLRAAALEDEQGEPLDAAQRHQADQEGLTGPEY